MGMSGRWARAYFGLEDTHGANKCMVALALMGKITRAVSASRSMITNDQGE